MSGQRVSQEKLSELTSRIRSLKKGQRITLEEGTKIIALGLRGSTFATGWRLETPGGSTLAREFARGLPGTEAKVAEIALTWRQHVPERTA